MSLAEIVTLRRENDALKARVAQLESLFGHDVELPRRWGLSPHQKAIVAALYRIPGISRHETLIVALYEERGWDEPDAARQTLGVQICHVRRKLRRDGCGVITHWGEGYSLDAAARAALDALNGGQP